MRWILLATLLSTSAAAAAPCELSRCSCMPSLGLEQAKLSADGIFFGSVLSSTEVRTPGDDPVFGVAAERLVRFQVLGTWKGISSEVVEVRTGASDADCGYPFEVGEHYLVFARGEPSLLITSLCTRTAPAEDAVEDLRELGTPYPPSG
jgi:hypothetical protein